MADQKIKKLARNLSQVKNLAADVNINTYYQEIRPFLFGRIDNTTPITITTIPNSGLYSVAKNGVLIPSNDPKIIVKIAGKTTTGFKIANVTNTKFISDLQKDENGNVAKNPADYFFPSDLVKTLTQLAKIFYKSKYNVDELEKFASGGDLDFVKKWGRVNANPELVAIDKDYFYEENFEKYHASDVKKLFEAVINAAIQFENLKQKPQLDGFAPQSEIENKILEEIIPQIYSGFISGVPEYLAKKDNYKEENFFEEKIKPLLEKEPDFVSEAAKKIEDSFKEKVFSTINDKRVDFFISFFGNQIILNNLKNLGVYDPETKYFLFDYRESPTQDGLKQTEDYQKFIKKSITSFLDKNTNELLDEFILPFFEEKKSQGAAGSGEASEETGGETPTTQEERVEIIEPVSLDEFKNKLKADITAVLSEIFLTNFAPTQDEGFSVYKIRIQNNYIQPVQQSFNEEIDNRILAEFEVKDKEKNELIQKGLYSLEKFDSKVFDTTWYQTLLQDSVDYIQNIPSPDPSFPSYFAFLYYQFIVPAIELYKQETPEQTAAEEAVKVSQQPSGAVVPTEIPTPPPDKQITVQTDQINRLTPEEIRKLQYESAWLYNRALYELYTSNGLNIEDINSLTLQNLQANIFSYTASLNKQDLALMFGSASYRERALLNFYQKHNIQIQSFLNSDELLFKSFYKTFDVDSPIFTQNIKNTIDALIIQYGLNQDFYEFDINSRKLTEFKGQNTHDIIWFIDNIPPQRLALIFNLPSGLVFNKEKIALLKETLKNYARCRASELSLSIQNTSLQKGLISLSDEEAELIKNGDEETIEKYLSITQNFRNISQKYGGETLAGALDEKDSKNSNRTKIQDQFKTFLPLWNQLSGEEQKYIYIKFGQENFIPKDFDGEINKLEFIPEFVFFDVREFGNIRKIIERNNLNIEKQKELEEILFIQDQLIREQKLAEFLNQDYQEYSLPEENEEISLFYDGAEQKNISLRERFVADQQLAPQRTQPQGFRNRVSNLLRRTKKLKTPIEKLKNTTKDAASEFASQAISKAAAGAASVLLPGVGTALGALLLRIKSRKARNIVSGLILGTVAAIISRTIWALGSIGGAIGGVIGGILGGATTLATTGTILGAIPGFVVGANIGELILGNRWWGFWNKNKQPSLYEQNQYQQNNALNKGLGTQNAATPGLIFTSYTGVALAATIAFPILIIFATLMIIITIHSAFLIPNPNSRSIGNEPELGPNGFECFIFGPGGTTVGTEFGDLIQSKEWTQGEKEKVYQAYTRKAGQNSCFKSYTCDYGPITIYRASGRQYGGWAPSQLLGNVLILYDLPFEDGDGIPYVDINGLEYTFIHELGHVIDYRGIKDFLNKFMAIWDQPNNGCLTYPYASLCNASEAFAESITLYVTYETYDYNTDGDPNTPRVKYDFPNEAPAEYEWVKKNIFCSEPLNDEEDSYIAIGPLDQNNVVASTDQEITNPQLTCNWRNSHNLDVAINANFFNDNSNKLVPVGLAGYCENGNNCSQPVKYYEDATSSTFNQYLKSFAYNKSGIPQTISGPETMRNVQNTLSMAVTGSYSDVQNSPDTANTRTIIGTGIANANCSKKYVGQSVIFMAVLPSSTFANAEQTLRDCGANDFIHLDGGGSSNFCSATKTFSQNRYIPVNMGLKDAEIVSISE